MSDAPQAVPQSAQQAPLQYVVIAGFVGEQVVDDETGRKAVHNRGDVVTVGQEITESAAQVELHRNRIVAAEASVVESIRAAERVAQGDPDAVFAGSVAGSVAGSGSVAP